MYVLTWNNSYWENYTETVRFHAQYWWHCHISRYDNDEYKKSNYDKHIESQNKSFITEGEIYKTLAKLTELQSQFETSVGRKLAKIENEYIKFEKAKEYDKNISHEELRNNLAEKDENELRELYLKKANPFENIYELMIEIFKKIFSNRFNKSNKSFKLLDIENGNKGN